MALIGSAIKMALGGYGDKPNIPLYQTTDPTVQAGKAVSGNLQNLGIGEDLASKTNQYNEDEILKIFRQLNPSFDQTQANTQNNLLSMSQGILPQDVVDQEQRGNAAWGINSGVGSGSGMGGARSARNLGLTSLDLINKSVPLISGYNASERSTLMPKLYDPSQDFVSPETAISTDLVNQGNLYQNNLLKAKTDAAPDPAMAGIGDAFITDESDILGAAGSAGGMAGGSE